MPITRSVKEDYWYTAQQIDCVGKAWQEMLPEERAYLYFTNGIDRPYRTAIEAHHVEAMAHTAKKILLPLNFGNSHWTSLAVEQTLGEEGKLNLHISFTNSSTTSPLQRARVNQEIERIIGIYQTQYEPEHLNITREDYPHTWKQEDGSSCGPYSLMNAMRCLDHHPKEANLGRKRIRELQLDMMQHSQSVDKNTAIKGCSTNDSIDEILTDWILHQIETHGPLRVSTPEEVEAICTYHADTYGKPKAEIAQIFHDEYCNIDRPYFRPVPVNERILSLIQELSITPKATQKKPELASKLTEVSTLIGQENITAKIDAIRVLLSKKTEDQAFVYATMAKLTELINHGELEGASTLIEDSNLAPTDKKISQQQLSEIIGTRRFAPSNQEKLVYLTSAYDALSQAIGKVKTIEANAPHQLIKAHIRLLEGAIQRNHAPLLRQVYYAINDFIASFMEWVTSGRWTSDIKRIETISQKLQDCSSQVTKAELQEELGALSTIITAQEELQKIQTPGLDAY